MDKKALKTYLLLISFTIGLVLVVVYFEDILHGIGLFLRLLTPLFVAVAIAFVLNRPYEWFREWYARRLKLKHKPAKAVAILTVYLLTIGIVALIICMVVPELIQNVKMAAENSDQYLSEIQIFINRITSTLGFQAVDLSDLNAALEKYVSTLADTINGMLPQIIEVTVNFATGVANTLIAVVLSVYIMSGKEELRMQVTRILRVYLPKRAQPKLKEFFQTISQVFGDYVAGQCKEAIILGSLCFAGMMVLRLDCAGLVSVNVAITALIPILGAFIGGATGVLLLLFVSPAKAVLFLIFFVVLQQIEGNVIYPKVVGRKIGLPGIWVLLGITVGGKLFGIGGVLLAVPITTIIYQFLKKDVFAREQAEVKEQV